MFPEQLIQEYGKRWTSQQKEQLYKDLADPRMGLLDGCDDVWILFQEWLNPDNKHLISYKWKGKKFQDVYFKMPETENYKESWYSVDKFKYHLAEEIKGISITHIKTELK